MYLELFIQFFHIRELLPIVEVPLVIAVAAFYLTVVPRCPGRDQLMGDTCRFQRNIKRTFLGVADIFISEFRTIDGEEVFYIPNPALGLWIDRQRMSE